MCGGMWKPGADTAVPLSLSLPVSIVLAGQGAPRICLSTPPLPALKLRTAPHPILRKFQDSHSDPRARTASTSLTASSLHPALIFRTCGLHPSFTSVEGLVFLHACHTQYTIHPDRLVKQTGKIPCKHEYSHHRSTVLVLTQPPRHRAE